MNTSLCKPYVYKLIHRETGKYYIGYREANVLPAVDDLPKYRSSSSTVRRLGFTNFDYEIIAELETGAAAYDLEQRLIEQFISDPLCLNGHYTKAGNLRYRRVGPHTKETKQKQSLAKKGIKFSDEHRAKLSEAKRGKKQPLDMVKKRSAKRVGVPLSQSHKEKISSGLKNHAISEDTKRKISESLKGIPLSEETKKKMSDSQKKRGGKRCTYGDRMFDSISEACIVLGMHRHVLMSDPLFKLRIAQLEHVHL